MATSLDKITFEAAQTARVGWFFGQKLLAARMSRPMPIPDRLRGRRMPDRRRILADLKALFEQDWRNIEAGALCTAGGGVRQCGHGIAPGNRLFRRSLRGRG